MPYIPLLKPNTDLAMPQVPALDRVPRPNIDVRGVLAAMEDLGRASLMPGINPEPFVEAAGAQGKAAGKGLMKIGDVMSTLAEKRLQAHEDKIRHSARADTETFQQNLQSRTKTGSDPEKILTQTKLELAGLHKLYDQVPGISGETQQGLTALLAANDRRAANEIDTQLIKDEFMGAKQAILADRSAAERNGNYDLSISLAGELALKGYASAQESRRLIRQTWATQREEVATVNPKGFLAELEKRKEERPAFVQNIDEERARQFANDQWIKGKSVVYQDAHRLLVEGGILDEADFDLQVESGRIDPLHLLDENEKAELRQRMARPGNDRAQAERTRLAITEYSAFDDDNERRITQLSNEIDRAFVSNVRDDLQNQLREQQRRTQGGRDLINETLTEAIRELQGDFEEERLGVYKVPASMVSWNEGGKIWVRERWQWEDAGAPVPIDLSKEDGAKLKNGTLASSAVVVDTRAREAALNQWAMRADYLRKGWAEGKYAAPGAVWDDHRNLMKEPIRALVARVLDDALSMEAPGYSGWQFQGPNSAI